MLKKFIVGSLIFLTLTNVCYAESINDIKERMQYTDDEVNAQGYKEQKAFSYNYTKGNYSTLESQTGAHQIHQDIRDNEDCYAEIKQGRPFEERFEAMAGVPTKEDMYVTWGADPVKMDYESVIVQSRAEENYLTVTQPTFMMPYYQTSMYNKPCELTVSGFAEACAGFNGTYPNGEAFLAKIGGEGATKVNLAIETHKAIQEAIEGTHTYTDDCGTPDAPCPGHECVWKTTCTLSGAYQLKIPSCCFADRRDDVTISIQAAAWKDSAPGACGTDHNTASGTFNFIC